MYDKLKKNETIKLHYIYSTVNFKIKLDKGN